MRLLWHLEPFLREASDRGAESGLPRFIEREFREFLTCGVLGHGFTRLQCADRTFERLLPSRASAEASVRAVGGRRMAEHAASLVDEVLPWVPVRQWVLTLPCRLRYRLAWDHALCRAVLGVYVRTLLAFYARTARWHGIQEGRTGTMTAIQRFGSGLQFAALQLYRRECLGAGRSRAGDRQTLKHGSRWRSQRVREVSDGAGDGEAERRREHGD